MIRKYDVMVTEVKRCTVEFDDEDPNVLSKDSSGFYPRMAEVAAREGHECTWAKVEYLYTPHQDFMAIQQPSVSDTFKHSPDCNDKNSCEKHGRCMYLGCSGSDTLLTPQATTAENSHSQNPDINHVSGTDGDMDDKGF